MHIYNGQFFDRLQAQISFFYEIHFRGKNGTIGSISGNLCWKKSEFYQHVTSEEPSTFQDFTIPVHKSEHQ